MEGMISLAPSSGLKWEQILLLGMKDGICDSDTNCPWNLPDQGSFQCASAAEWIHLGKYIRVDLTFQCPCTTRKHQIRPVTQGLTL